MIPNCLAIFAIAFSMIPSQVSSTYAKNYQDATGTNMLVNRQHMVAATYTPPDLETPDVLTLHIPTDEEAKLRAAAATHLTAMFAAAERDLGMPLVLSSGYRSFVAQKLIYESALQTLGTSANEVVAPPGMSEHQTGLAADIITESRFCAAQACFAMTRASDWLYKHSFEYGFILRYPAYQHGSTGYSFEPWHYRYIGIASAQAIHTSGPTLEQYYKGKPASLTP